METPEYIRFSAYVRSTTRVEAVAKRMQLFSWLNGPSHSSISGLVAAIGGNSKDRDWVAQAIKDGEVVVGTDRRLGLPAPKSGLPSPDYVISLARVLDALNVLAAFHETELWAFRLVDQVEDIQGHLREGLTFAEAARFAQHRDCSPGECVACSVCPENPGEYQ